MYISFIYQGKVTLKRSKCGTTSELAMAMICDIYDGAVYQEQMASGFLSNQSNISFILNTDGVPVFCSSSFSFWPIYLIINELPHEPWNMKTNDRHFTLKNVKLDK